jgi:hypothetical protein
MKYDIQMDIQSSTNGSIQPRKTATDTSIKSGRVKVD